jgi:hypothetical protein
MLADISANPPCKQNPNGARTAHTLNCCRDQLLRSRFQQLCQRVRHLVSTRKINNVSRFHGGVSRLVGLLSHNKNSTRYAANLQILKHQIQS